MFCPQCRYEYIDTVWICPDCGQKLVDHIPEEDTQMVDVEKHIRFVPLPDLPGRVYADMVKGALETRGIPCYVQPDGAGGVLRASGTGFPASSVQLYVPEDRLKECLEIQHQMLNHI
jgi:hypothetical protein